MPILLLQTGSNSSATIMIAAIVLVLAIGIMAFMFVRSAGQRKERESRVRQRLLEMEREGQFAAAADRVTISRRPAEIVTQITGLFHEYLSMGVLGVYAGQATDGNLFNVPGEAEVFAPAVTLPDVIPETLLTEYAGPAVVSLAVIVGRQAPDSPVAEEPADAEEPLVGEEPAGEQIVNTTEGAADIEQANNRAESASESPARSGIEDVMLVPWHGPFQWKGLIVVSVPALIPADALDPYREALARLTQTLAVALELELSDAAIEAFDERASRTTEFSRSLISCLEEVSPLDAIVRELTRLMGSDSAALWRVDEGGAMVRMVAAFGLTSPEFLPLPIGQGLAGEVAQKGETLGIEDAPADPRCIFPREARESGVVAYLGAALAADSEILGVIEVHCAGRRTWTESDRLALESAATVISELVKSSDSRGNRLRVESAYLGLSEALQRLGSPDEVKEAVAEVLGHALGASRVVVVELNDRGQTDPIRHEYRQPSAKSALGVTFADARFAEIASSAGTQSIAIAGAQEQSLMGVEKAAELDVMSELAVPIRVDGKTSAIVYVHQCDRAREWEHEEVEFAERVVRQLSLSLSNLGAREVALAEAQQARDQARRANEESSRAEAMLTGLPEMVFGLDGLGNLTFYNAAAAERRDLTPDHLGHPAESLTDADNTIWRQITMCESVARFDARMNLRLGGTENAVEPVSISATPVRNGDGEIIGRLIVASDLSHIKPGDASDRIKELEQKLQRIERVLTDSREMEEQARARLVEASELEASARSEADASRLAEAEARQQLERVEEEHKQVKGSAGQLLEINKLKSEFIVNAGREIEASLQSVLGLSELLERGSYGTLTPEQVEAVHGIYGWARRIKSDVDWLIEYGSTRTRRLEGSGGN